MADPPSDRGPPMFPLMLNVERVPIMVVGTNVTARLDMLREYQANDVHVFDSLRGPGASDFARIRPRLVFIADIDDLAAAALRNLAHGVGAFVHVQDRIALCDFHLPARLRRGRLQVTISTDGAAAGLSRLLREHLEATTFGPEWAARVEELALARQQWKSEGRSMTDIARALADFVTARAWLKK